MAAGGVAGVITSPFQSVDQPSGSARGGEGVAGRWRREREKGKAIKNQGSGNMSLANRQGGGDFTAAGGDK